jgi:hypothetical protein
MAVVARSPTDSHAALGHDEAMVIASSIVVRDEVPFDLSVM